MYVELEELNMECEGTLSRECSLDAVAARNVLKVALASKAAVEDALECASSSTEEDEEDCLPYEMHQIPTATTGTELEHIVECAEQGQCDVEEMTQMIEGKTTCDTRSSFALCLGLLANDRRFVYANRT